MNNIYNFLTEVLSDLQVILSGHILPGVSLYTVLLYSLLATCFFSVFTRR